MNRYEEFIFQLLNGEKILIDSGTGNEVERRGHYYWRLLRHWP